MSKWAIVRGDIVENVIIWDGETPYAAPAGTTLIELINKSAAPGHTYVDGDFVAPELPADEPAA
jgi:hypothetical protein